MRNTDYDPATPIPKRIPLIKHDRKGEPRVVRQHVLPRWFAAFLLILAAATAVQGTFLQFQVHRDENQRSSDQKTFNTKIQGQITANHELAVRANHDEKELQLQQRIDERRQTDLVHLVAAVLGSTTPQQATRALKKFLRQSRNEPPAASVRNHANPTGSQTSTSHPTSHPSSNPRPQPSSHPTSRSSPRPTPRPTQTPTQKPTHGPVPQPVQSVICNTERLILGSCPSSMTVSLLLPVS